MANLHATVCANGWAQREQDRLLPASVSSGLKVALIRAENLSGPTSLYSLDQYLAVEDGGSPNDLQNLWVQPFNGDYGAVEKDREDNLLHLRLCAGAMTLDEALVQIRTDWSPPPP